MKIRSITCFYHPGTPHAVQVLNRLGELVNTATRRYTEAGFEVQTTRLAMVPFPLVLPALVRDAAVQYAVDLQARTQQIGFSYISLGPALASLPESYDLVVPMLAATKNVFLSGEIANRDEGVMLDGIKACGRIIAQAARITPDGFTNLRFAAAANIPAYTPYFPVAYAHDAQPAFGLAMEAADLVLGIFRSARSLASARKRLIQVLEAQARVLAAIGEDLEKTFEIEFKGIDISLAPYPGTLSSLGAALEQLGVNRLGLSGSLAAVSFLADTLDRGNWLRIGFNSMMLSVLEDSTLAARAAEGALRINDLLLYSSVCGTGLDCIPLPGDASPEQLAAVVLDVAALSTRLHKPLIARLMPIPNKKTGDAIQFSFEYFSDGRVMELPAAPLHGVLAGSENYQMNLRST